MSVPRIGVFGWGVVAPKSPTIEAFERNLATATSWLSPFNGYGPDNFLVGDPEFNFADYKAWIDARFAPRHYRTLKEKMDLPVQYALGAFIQSLAQNPGMEQELQALGTQAHVYIGTGLGSLAVIHDSSVTLYKSQRRWNRFWCHPDRNPALAAYLASGTHDGATPPPVNPATIDAATAPDARDEAEEKWLAYWIHHSAGLREFLDELATIDSNSVQGADIEAAKLSAIRDREKRRQRLQEKWGAPEPPWFVSANVIWNIPNVPASQVSILGKITGFAFAPVAACSTFGVSLKVAMDSIFRGEAKAVVVGATDSSPNSLTVGAFQSARVLSAGRSPSVPLTKLQGTHVAGGAVVWILGDMDYMMSKGFRPLGMEPVAAGVSSDADHIITPSADGARTAIRLALAEAHATPDQVGSWDLHATATPGDFMEMQTMRSVIPERVLVTARKGTFGHGMSAGGGWELTAQYLGYQNGAILPTPLAPEDYNEAIKSVHQNVVFNTPCPLPEGLAGKISMGIGGINACLLSKPLPK